MIRLVPAAAALAAIVMAPALAAPRPTGEQQLQKMLAGATPGEPVDCLPPARSLDSTKIDRTAIVYRDGRTFYVNRFRDGCPSLDQFRAIVTRTTTSSVCRGDIARLIDPVTGIEGASCVFDQFVPYRKPRRSN